MFWRGIKLWVLSLYTDFISRLGVTDKSEGSKGVCWVSGIVTVFRLTTRLSETEDVQSIWMFLKKLQLSSNHFHPALHFALSFSRYQQVQFGF